MKIHIVQIPVCGRGITWNKDFEFGFFIYNPEGGTKIFRPRNPSFFYEPVPNFSEQIPKGFEFIEA